jgi:hypothetical protein
VVSTLQVALDDLSDAIAAGLPPAELIDTITVLQKFTRRASAVGYQAIAAYADTVRAEDEYRGTSREKTSADALTHEMPETRSALRDGHIDELTARDVVGETSHLSVEDRGTVDATLVTELHRPGASGWQISRSARALADQIDPAAAVARRTKAEGTRRATIRPGHDSLAVLSLTGPIADTVSCHAALDRAVREHRLDVPDDERSDSQLRYDIAVERLTGRQIATDPVPVSLTLVMTEEAMFRDGHQAASILGHGPIAAAHARELVHSAAERDRAWVTRLYTHPHDDALIAMDSGRRLFPPGLATFLRLRDQRCATPYCDAPVQHIDHIQPWSQGGTTTLDNGQGLCARCNHTKDLAGLRTVYDPDTRVTTFITRTGHAYPREPPPALGHPTLPERRKAGRRASDWAVAA